MIQCSLRSAVAVALVFGAVACEGPVGPEGPRGPEGPAGPGTRMTFTGQLDDIGDATVNLPAEAGTLDEPPSVTCYIADVPDGTYLAIASDGSSAPSCGFGETGSGTLAAIIVGGPANWYYRIVVVY